MGGNIGSDTTQCKWYDVFVAILVQATDCMCLACGILSQTLGCIIEMAWWTVSMIAAPLLGSSYASAPETGGKSQCWVPQLLLYPTTLTGRSWSMNNRAFFPRVHVSP